MPQHLELPLYGLAWIRLLGLLGESSDLGLKRIISCFHLLFNWYPLLKVFVLFLTSQLLLLTLQIEKT